MSEIQDSLDQLLHTVKNAENGEKVDIYYVIEPKNSGRFTDDSNGGTILHITAEHRKVHISIEAGPDLRVQDKSDKTTIILENKPYQFIEAIKDLLEASTIRARIVGERVPSKLERYDSFECVLKIVLDIIHWECQNKPQVTAEKLISLRYPLVQVVSLGNAEVIEHMLIRGCPVDDRDSTEKLTALGKAVRFMDLEIVKVLIKYGADVDLADSRGMLPIAHYNTWYAHGQQPEIIKILLNKSILLRDFTREGAVWQFRGAFRWGNQEVVQMLLEYHNNILNVRDTHNRTPLHYLSKNSHSDITELLKSREIDVDVRDEENCTPLYMATESPHSHVNTLKFLLENGADVNARNNFELLSVPLLALCYCHSDEKERYFKIIELFLQYDVDIQYVGPGQTTVFDAIGENFSFYMSKPLLARLAILEEQGQPIEELIRNKINSHEIFKNEFELCKSELREMKNYVVDENLTLYTIFLNRVSEKQILKSYRFSPNALTNFDKLKKEFHVDNCYYIDVQKCISSITLVLELSQKAALIVSKLLQLGNNPSHIIVTEIIDYLDSQDLQTLVKVKVKNNM